MSMHAVHLSDRCMHCMYKINEQIFHKSKSAHASDKKINSRVAHTELSMYSISLITGAENSLQLSYNRLIRILNFNTNTVIVHAVHFIGNG